MIKFIFSCRYHLGHLSDNGVLYRLHPFLAISILYTNQSNFKTFRFDKSQLSIHNHINVWSTLLLFSQVRISDDFTSVTSQFTERCTIKLQHMPLRKIIFILKAAHAYLWKNMHFVELICISIYEYAFWWKHMRIY